MSTDILSELLRALSLRANAHYFLEFDGNWALAMPPTRALAPTMVQPAEHLMQYHVVLEGSAWLEVDDAAPLRLGAGDIVVIPHGLAHLLASDPLHKAVPFDAGCVESALGDTGASVRATPMQPSRPYGGNPAAGAATRIAGGFLGCDLSSASSLFAMLPQLCHLQPDSTSGWVNHGMVQAIRGLHARCQGARTALERISEVMLVCAIRRHLDTLPSGNPTLLAGLSDRRVGRALALINERAGHPWTVDKLAHEVALSRSALYSRFVNVVGQPPMRYLANRRMEIALSSLRQTRAPISRIALDVGYGSEAAFTRAFTRLLGMPPARWRRDRAVLG